jgi:hypothetical protein
MNSKVAVVILNWNGKSFLEQFLPGVIDYSKDVAEIIISSSIPILKLLQTGFSLSSN